MTVSRGQVRARVLRLPLFPITVGVVTFAYAGWTAGYLAFAVTLGVFAVVELVLNATGRLDPQWSWPVVNLALSVTLLTSPLWS